LPAKISARVLERVSTVPDDAGQGGKTPGCREPEHHERNGEARRLHGPAEEGVLRQAALQLHRRGEGKGPCETGPQHGPDLGLRGELGALHPHRGQHSASAHHAVLRATRLGRQRIAGGGGGGWERVRSVRRESQEQRLQRAVLALEAAHRDPCLTEREDVTIELALAAAHVEADTVDGGCDLHAADREGADVVARAKPVDGAGRALPQLVDGARKGDLAVMEDRQDGAEVFDFCHVVAAQKDGDPLGGETSDARAQVPGTRRVE
jgi:hypothetical protein